jgi:Helix-turn-helix domain
MSMTPMLTVPQIAAMTGRSRRTIIRWFENEPGVVLLDIFDHREGLHKRRYRSLRIPRAVVDRVLARLSRTGLWP